MKIIRISAIWCPSCIIMQNRWAKLSKSIENISFEDYDYDRDEEFCKNLQIGTKLPVCIFYRGEEEIYRMIGEKSEKEMKKILEMYGDIK